MEDTAAVPGTLCYFEIPAPDLEKAGDFYRSVFAWRVEVSGQYMSCSAADGQLLCGLDPIKRPAPDGGILIYLKVGDIAATLDRIREAGGAVVLGKSPVGSDPQWGFSAVFRDPGGNQIGLWSRG